MYLSKDASRIRQREAENARRNRMEIVKAKALGQITRRDMIKWGLITTTGLLVVKNGLSPFARSAFADIPTGTPLSPLFGVQKFTTPMPRLALQQPIPLVRNQFDHAEWPAHLDERPAKRLSYHTDFTAAQQDGNSQLLAEFTNPISGRGPIEGRPPGEIFAHQRWDEYFPKVGYIMSWGRQAAGTRFHPGLPDQSQLDPDAVWTWGTGRFSQGTLPPALIKMRYGEPVLFRAYNNTPVDREEHGIFGRNETQLHFHNAHNGAESDGAANVHHFPGTFYDYRWSTTLARADIINTQAGDPRASGPDGNGGVVQVPGDFREIQGTMWAHDHRFFFTAENVYKGNLMMINMYSGPDRGNEELEDGVNLRLPSGSLLDWGNTDFDVNLIISDAAFNQDGQYFWDIFAVDGFLGDVPLVNFAYAPYFEVLPRKYRFRILNASMSRFYKLALAKGSTRVPFKFIANDGNLLVSPINSSNLRPSHTLPRQGNAERYDIVVDFSQFSVGDTIRMYNMLEMRDDGRGPKDDEEEDWDISWSEVLNGTLASGAGDPTLSAIMEFRVVSQVESVDVPGVFHNASDPDSSRVPNQLTEQISIVQPVRTRHVEFGRSGSGTTVTGECTPDCPEQIANFPWSIKVNGEDSHTMNANRISLVIPKPGDVEHWTYVNGGGGWDHPIHLHFEEAVTMYRGRKGRDWIGNYEKNVRKDVWRLGTDGDRSVTFQVRFGEFGGSYVNHCHNTVHEDFAMLLRMQVLSDDPNSLFADVTPTPNPTPDGVFFTEPEILAEGDPRGTV
jgi:FtsP/CotA-like multicopper oxidase with cupredoxin domain